MTRRLRATFAALVCAFSLLSPVGPITLHAQNQIPRNNLPQAAADFDGDLEVQYEDWTGGARLRHFLRTGGQRLELQFPGQPPALLTGTRVRARGTLQNNALMLASAGSVRTLAPAPAPSTFGEQPTIVILVNFQDNPITPYTPAAAQAATFETTSKFYLENSYQQTWLTGAVYGWYTIAMNSNNCDTSQIATLAERAASQGGANLSAYTHRIYAFPQTTACGWWGLGSVGGSPSQAWVNGTYVVRVVGHEFGHNLGDYHSHSNPCDASGCTYSEYGDDHDIMGATTAHFNAFQKERFGWLNYGNSPPMTVVSQSNNYWLDAYEPPGAASKALKILKSTNGGGQKTWYFVETRAQFGFDGGVTAGVVIHTAADGNADSSTQIDLSPDSTTFGSVLAPGQTFSDPALGLSITTLSVDATGALVEVAFNGTQCVRANPTVSISPGQSPPVAPGGSSFFNVLVWNNDSPSCSADGINVSATVPAGWSYVVGNPVLTIDPGASVSTTLLVMSSLSAGDGPYPILAVATESDVTKAGSRTATFSVVSSLTAQVSTDKTSYTRNQTAVATARVWAGGADAVNADVTFTFTKADGSRVSAAVRTDGNGVATYKLRFSRKDPLGAYQANVVANLNGILGSGGTSFTVR